jgi:hypothetical protein
MASPTRILAPLALTLALFAGACKEKSSNDTMTQDTTLSRDLQLANRDTASQPQLKDIPPASAPEPAPAAKPAPRPTTPAPRKTTPTPAPKPKPTTPTTTPSGNTVQENTKGSEPALGTIPAGSVINLASNDKVCTNTNKAGDRFTATVSDAVVGSNGAVIPAGAKAVIQISDLKKSGNASQPIEMTFSVLSISWNGKTYPVNGSIEHVDVEKVRSASTKSDVGKVAGGAAIGAILGQVIGKNTKSTVIGAAAGAAAGTAVAMGTADYDGCVPSGGNIKVKLNEPATVAME